MSSTPANAVPLDQRPAASAVSAGAGGRRRTGLATGLPAGVVVAVLLVSIALGAPPVAVAVPAAIVAVATAGIWVIAPRLLTRRLRRLGAESVDPVRDARLVNLAEGVCLGSGIPLPELLVLPDAEPNAVALGRGPDDAVVVCTTGLLTLLDRIELEAVLAHEVAHIRAGETLPGCVTAVTFGRLSPALAARVSGPARESLADQAAVSVTRYPPGLASALVKLQAAPAVLPASLPAGFARQTSHLWLVPLVPPAPGARRVPGALDLDERIALLREL